MARGKKRKAPKNSNYRNGLTTDLGSGKSELKEKKEKKVTGTVYALFTFFTVVFLAYFLYYTFIGNGDSVENFTHYLLPGIITAIVAIITYIKKI